MGWTRHSCTRSQTCSCFPPAVASAVVLDVVELTSPGGDTLASSATLCSCDGVGELDARDRRRVPTLLLPRHKPLEPRRSVVMSELKVRVRWTRCRPELERSTVKLHVAVASLTSRLGVAPPAASEIAISAASRC